MKNASAHYHLEDAVTAGREAARVARTSLYVHDEQPPTDGLA